LTGEVSVSGPIPRVRKEMWKKKVWDDLDPLLGKEGGPVLSDYEEEEESAHGRSAMRIIFTMVLVCQRKVHPDFGTVMMRQLWNKWANIGEGAG